jgi:DNA-binding NtrC family response regulator
MVFITGCSPYPSISPPPGKTGGYSHFGQILPGKAQPQVQQESAGGVDPKAMKILCRHAWPGNVRELQHVLEYCFVFAKGSLITERHLPRLESPWVGRELDAVLTAGAASPLQTLERKTIIMALEKAQGSKQEASRILKISRSKLWRKMRLYQIHDGDFKK